MTKHICWMVLAIFSAVFSFAENREQCTTAVVHFSAATEGAPLLWKNRDTTEFSNKVIFVRETPLSYVGLVNAAGGSGRQCYVGLNSAGFAIMNTVAYNLPRKSGEMQDLEGVIMGDALRTCRSVDDFARYLQVNTGPDLGASTNFGVIDASGNAELFEVYNHGCRRLSAADTTEKFLVNTNFSRSGEPGKGAGYLRFERATQLFGQFPPLAVDHRRVLHEFTRDFGHVLLRHPQAMDLKRIPAGEDCWLFTRDCIDRPSTSAAAVIVGKKPKEPGSPAVMWIIPGEPLCAVAVPVFVDAGCSPDPLWNGDQAPLWRESLRIKSIARPLREENKIDYLNAARLDNAGGTGFLPLILKAEEEIMKETDDFLKRRRKPAELAEFQKRMAEKALAVMQGIGQD